MKYHIDTLPFSIAKKHPNSFDQKGVLLSKIPYTKQYNYHTTAIASYAIVNSENQQIFYTQINWLMENITSDGSYQHDFSFPFYDNFPKPWVGGLCQGLAISALILAYKKYNDQKYLDTAFKAFTCLKRDIKDNGCLYTDDSGYKWIEEYPVKPKILNGFIYALFGVYDLYDATKNIEVKHLFDCCIDTLKTHLHLYDIKYWSLYDQIEKFPATTFYHTVHVKQLKALYKITKEEIFNEYAKHWEKASKNMKNKFKVKRVRTVLIIKKRGFIKSIQRYIHRRRWKHG